MRQRNTWLSIAMILAVALLLAVGDSSLFRGGKVQAQEGPLLLPSFPSADFKCHVINHGEAPAPPNNVVTLRDQFDSESPTEPEVMVREPQILCAPASKNLAAADLEGVHLKCYNITPAGPPPPQDRRMNTLCDQFDEPPCVTNTIPPPPVLGGDAVQVQTAQLLCTLACKNPTVGFPGCLTPTATPPPTD